jgi:hypothetical protein
MPPDTPLPEREGQTFEYHNPRETRDDHAIMKVVRRGTGYYGDNGDFDFEARDADECRAKLTRWGFTNRID